MIPIQTKTTLLALFLCSIFGATGQFNDTIVYKSGMIKVGEVEALNDKDLDFKYVRAKQDTATITVKLFTLRSVRMYDPDGVLTYDKTDVEEMEKEAQRVKNANDSVSVSVHVITVNPFFLLYGSPSLRYNYRFGRRLQWALNVRSTFHGPVVDGDNFSNYGNFWFGAGLQFATHRSKLSFGGDITPMIVMNTREGDDTPSFLVPFSITWLIHIKPYLSFSFDMGTGTAFTGSGVETFVRGNFGFTWNLPERKTISNSWDK